MTTIKYQIDWNYSTFLYKNFGCSATKEQKGKALGTFLSMGKKNNLKKIDLS